MKDWKEVIVVPVVAGAILAGMFVVFDSRISDLENGQSYVFEVIRQRPVPAEFCKALSDGRMACTTNAQRLCRCQFFADQQDTEMQMLQEEIARRLDAERKAEKAAAAIRREAEDAG